MRIHARIFRSFVSNEALPIPRQRYWLTRRHCDRAFASRLLRALAVRVTLAAHENEPDRSVQRRRYRHSYYHHGFGIEGAARSDPGFPRADVADLFCLCLELH